MGMKSDLMPSEIVLSGILYNVTVHEGLIVFEQAICISGFHTRMAFTRTDYKGGGCWYLEMSDSHNEVMVSHIVQAYALICSAYGGNFEEKAPVT